jgi:hypothetical protein
MSAFLQFLNSLFNRRASPAPASADEAYLAASVDIYDLERRMRAIDDGRRGALSGIAFGLYPR